jgi:hypothetical protein
MIREAREATSAVKFFDWSKRGGAAGWLSLLFALPKILELGGQETIGC